eukprot:CAMPEP_0119051866 /NCGR_PEP_ID=MMETSP1177-20130426/73345_1 /TAXON_ID=2985 /ORGANISM="Ochromonas sp, Strain CCMP1899" /LENGTH=189 /DNA_ID=CAMNT_0007031221 /DNA_START=3146 /DNA_END=3715 /DNA_ORIENTATION=+
MDFSRAVSAYVPAIPTEMSLEDKNKMKAAEIASSIPDLNSETAIDLKSETAKVRPVIPVLTAAEMLKQNIQPRIEHIKEISFAMKTFPTILDKGDYIALRGGFRSMPAMDLRKTCKLLKPFLVGDEKKVEFEKTYTIMIDAVNDIDVLALKRVQGSGLPKNGLKDEKMVSLLTDAITKMDDLLVILEKP